MQDEVRDCSCCNNCNQGGLFGNLFGGCNNDSTILFFIIIFLLFLQISDVDAEDSKKSICIFLTYMLQYNSF